MKKLAIASAVSAALCASNAFALPQNAIDPENPDANDVVMHFAGATAQKKAIQDLASQLCTPVSLTEYNEVETTTSEDALVITCTLGPAAGALENKDLYFGYFLDGGSYFGVTPVTDQHQLPYMNVFSGTCDAVTNECENEPTVPSSQYMAAPVAGASDVEPALFKGSNLSAEYPFGAPTSAGLANTVQTSAFVVTFGVPVHCSMLDWSVYTSCADSSYADAGGTQGNITSLRKSTISGIFKGDINAWDDVQEADAVGALKVINVCRRTPGSGTQAAAQVYFVNQECSTTNAYNFTSAATAAFGNVTEVSSSTQILRNCMNGGLTEDPGYNALTRVDTIALSSLEKQPNAGSHGTNWAYVAIDGVMPTDENAAMGLYDYQFENSLQYNSAVATADQVTFMNEFFAQAKLASNLTLPGTFAVHGSAGNTADNPFVSTNRVSWTSRDNNSCKPLYQKFPKVF